MPIVLADVFKGQELASITADFDLMNQLFDDMYDQMNDNVGRIFRPFGRVLHLIDERFKNLERTIMKKNRAYAWQISTELHQTTDEAIRQQIMARIESQSAAMGLKVVKLPLLLRGVVQLIAKKEFGTPAQKIDVMLRTALLPTLGEKTP